LDAVHISAGEILENNEMMSLIREKRNTEYKI
jgi:hypothetical protein